MKTEPGADGSEELGKESAVVALSGLVEKVFAATVVGPVLINRPDDRGPVQILSNEKLDTPESPLGRDY